MRDEKPDCYLCEEPGNYYFPNPAPLCPRCFTLYVKPNLPRVPPPIPSPRPTPIVHDPLFQYTLEDIP